MRFFLIRRGHYAKLHMAEKNEGKDREKPPKIGCSGFRKYLQILFPMRMGKFSRRLQNGGRSQYRDDDTSENHILEDSEKVPALLENEFAKHFLRTASKQFAKEKKSAYKMLLTHWLSVADG